MIGASRTFLYSAVETDPTLWDQDPISIQSFLANTLAQIPNIMCFIWVTETEYISLHIYLHITCRLSNLALTHSASNCAPWLGVWQLARKTNLNTSCQKETFWAPYNMLMGFCFTCSATLQKKNRWTPSRNNDGVLFCLLVCSAACVRSFMFVIVDFAHWQRQKLMTSFVYITLLLWG